MVVDTSALVAILRDEPERDEFTRLLARAVDPLISAATLTESSIVMRGREGPRGIPRLDALLRDVGVRVVPFDDEQAVAARDAWARYGKGNAPAALNLGDCFSYALATTFDRPLLYKGEDFSQTDIPSAR